MSDGQEVNNVENAAAFAEAQPVRRVGFAGLGVIGRPMARRVLEAGFELHVWNRSPDKAAALVAAGAKLAGTPAELAWQVDVLCVCVTDDRALEQVIFDEQGVASARRRGELTGSALTALKTWRSSQTSAAKPARRCR